MGEQEVIIPCPCHHKTGEVGSAPHAHSFVNDLCTPVLTRLTLLCCSGKVQGLLTLVSICLVAGGMDGESFPLPLLPCPVIPGEGGMAGPMVTRAQGILFIDVPPLR